MQSEKKMYVCPFEGCTSAFNRPYRLAEHRFSHMNIKPFMCTEQNCKKEYTCRSHLVRHINSVHRKTDLEILFCCKYCMKKFSNRQNLKRHIVRDHEDSKKNYQCDYCSKLFKKKSEISIHMYKHTGVKAFRCKICDKEFIRPSLRNQHMVKHKTYSCSDCDSIFHKWKNYLEHRRKDHHCTTYTCNDCGKEYKDRTGITRHVKVHMEIPAKPVFFCPYKDCKSYYSRNSNLNQHISLKHMDKRFDCPLCPMRLSTKAKLYEHIERHNRPPKRGVKKKTIDTGRQVRKDVNSFKISTAMKLAGIYDARIHKTQNSTNILYLKTISGVNLKI